MKLKTVRAESFNYIINVLRRVKRNSFFCYQVAFKDDHKKRLRQIDETVLRFMSNNILLSSYSTINPEFKKFGVYVLLADLKTFNPRFIEICKSKLNLTFRIIHTGKHNVLGVPEDRYVCLPSDTIWVDFSEIEYFTIISFDDSEDLSVIDEVDPRLN